MGWLRALLTLGACANVLLAQATVRPELRVGVQQSDPTNAIHPVHSFDALRRHLQAALPEYAISFEMLERGRLDEAIRSDRLHFFVANSGTFVEAEAEHGATALATVDRRDGAAGEALAGAVVVPAHRRDLNRLEDLAGKRVVAISELAFAGFQIPLHALWRAGVHREDLTSLSFTGRPSDQLLTELIAGRAEAALLHLCLFERLTAEPQFAGYRFRVLNREVHDASGCARSTALYPDWPFAATRVVDAQLAKRVAVALLSKRPGPGEFGWNVPTDYTRVHQLFRDLRLGPYHDTPPSLVHLVRRHWQWLLLLPLVLAAFVLHSLRANRLVSERTRELRVALEQRDRLAREARAHDEAMGQLQRLGALGEMSSMIAHEINQPLAGIRNYASGIVRRLRNGHTEPAAVLQASEEIEQLAARAAATVQRVRSLSQRRLHARAPVALPTLVDRALAAFRAALPPDQALTVQCGAVPAVVIDVDSLQIEQVLLNLLRNGLDAMRDVPAEQRVLRIACEATAQALRVAVTDCGAGLDTLPPERLFEPFFTTKPNGVGLGLAICKRVIEAHGGNIEARSNAPEPGLTVAFTLPLESHPVAASREEAAHA